MTVHALAWTDYILSTQGFSHNLQSKMDVSAPRFVIGFTQRGAGECLNRGCSGISAKKKMKKKLTLLTLLACFVALGLFSSCTKEDVDVVITDVTYDLKGTQWTTEIQNPQEGMIRASFVTDNSGSFTTSWGSGVGGTYNFTYSVSGSYGVLSFAEHCDNFVYENIPRQAELHLIDKNTLSIGGCVFTRQ